MNFTPRLEKVELEPELNVDLQDSSYIRGQQTIAHGQNPSLPFSLTCCCSMRM